LLKKCQKEEKKLGLTCDLRTLASSCAPKGKVNRPTKVRDTLGRVAVFLGALCCLI